jgi:hypothetical protein
LNGEVEDRQPVARPEKVSERARLAEALRENLRRRKAQNHARAATAETQANAKLKPSA